jgi:excinuclease UvrABC ATPase subunit
MPSQARPDVDVLEGLTTAIIVDQERMGANARSTVGTATDANAMLRIIFSRLGQPQIGSPQAYSFNVASAHGVGAVTVDKANSQAQKQTFTVVGGMCPRCEGWDRFRILTDPIYDESKSLNEGALTIPAIAWKAGTGESITAAVLRCRQAIKSFNKRELHDLLYKDATKIKIDGINLTYQGLIPQIQKSFLSKDLDAMQPHIRAFVERAVIFATCPECDGTRLNAAARSSRIDGVNIADVCAMQISDLAEWVRKLDEPSVAPLLAPCSNSSTRSTPLGWAISRSTGPRAHCRAVKPSAPR